MSGGLSSPHSGSFSFSSWIPVWASGIGPDSGMTLPGKALRRPDSLGQHGDSVCRYYVERRCFFALGSVGVRRTILSDVVDSVKSLWGRGRRRRSGRLARGLCLVSLLSLISGTVRHTTGNVGRDDKYRIIVLAESSGSPPAPRWDITVHRRAGRLVQSSHVQGCQPSKKVKGSKRGT